MGHEYRWLKESYPPASNYARFLMDLAARMRNLYRVSLKPLNLQGCPRAARVLSKKCEFS